MAREQRQHTRITKSRDKVRQERVVEQTPSTRNVLVSRITKLLWLLTAIIVGFITLRIVFLLIGANTSSDFVAAIVNFTNIFVSPFNGIIEAPVINGEAVLDVAAVFAIFIYVILAWIIIQLFRIVFSGTSTARKVSTVEKRIE